VSHLYLFFSSRDSRGQTIDYYKVGCQLCLGFLSPQRDKSHPLLNPMDEIRTIVKEEGFGFIHSDHSPLHYSRLSFHGRKEDHRDDLAFIV